MATAREARDWARTVLDRPMIGESPECYCGISTAAVHAGAVVMHHQRSAAAGEFTAVRFAQASASAGD